MRLAGKAVLVLGGLVLGLAGGATVWAKNTVSGRAVTVPQTKKTYFRVDRTAPLSRVLKEMELAGIVNGAGDLATALMVLRRTGMVAEGTYLVPPHATGDQLIASLKRPYRQMVRVPEGRWVAQVAQTMDENAVCTAQEYASAAADSTLFADELEGLQPKNGSLEGYLFPDTYELAPLAGAVSAVRTQLRTFNSKVRPLGKADTDWHRVLTIASMVEREAAKDAERARIAGVIENRLARGMRLEIDATVLYAMQEWKVLKPGEVRTVDSPYNTYLVAGLPPGPICSPGVKSVQAALTPEKHNFLFYVARPDKSHYFSASYGEHLANIRRARAEARE